MNNKLFYLLLMVATIPVSSRTQEIKRDFIFDANWQFFRGKTEGAENPGFDDKNWRMIDLPHDWSIEDLPGSGSTTLPNGRTRIISGPFDSEAPNGNSTGYTIGGTGWYRKHFKAPGEWAGKVISIYFDGVYMNADVWINGFHLGNHPYGYTAFGYDLSPYLHFNDSDNVIAVEVKNEGSNTRWYAGSGMYRHVTLEITNKIHVAHWGSYISTRAANAQHATVAVKTTINNSTPQPADIEVIYTIFDAQAKKVAEKKLSTQLFRNLSSSVDFTIEIPAPALWCFESPVLYKAVCEIKNGVETLDKTETTFGIRTLRFDSEKGFFLNEKPVKLKGGSMHANNGPLGAVANDRAEERRVELMKAAGFNAIRCAHNPPSTVFLEACDKLGMLVIDEAFDVWTIGWRDDDYHIYFNQWWKKDIASMVMRDRNHPSIFTWGICNQVRENRDSIGIALAYEVVDLVHTLDPSRPVMANVAQSGQNWRNCPPEAWKKCDPFFDALDICGYSYQSSQYTTDHQRLPNRILFSTEIDPRHSFDNWMNAVDNDFVLGNFEWTAMDLMGEVALGWWGFTKNKEKLYPWTSTYSGDIDLCGFRRPRSYYRDILFNQGNKLSVFVYTPVPSFDGDGMSPWGWDDVKPSWTWPGYEGKSLTVVAYSACDSVTLFLNNKLLGAKTSSRATEFKATWQVPYEPGTLKAVGYTNGIETASWEMVTAGKPARIRLSADRPVIKADGNDLSYVTVEITDKNGHPDPRYSDLIHFSIQGEGTIAAVGNANPISVESFQQPWRKAYEGKCLVIVRSKKQAGKIILKASGKGLREEKIMINSESK